MEQVNLLLAIAWAVGPELGSVQLTISFISVLEKHKLRFVFYKSPANLLDYSQPATGSGQFSRSFRSVQSLGSAA